MERMPAPTSSNVRALKKHLLTLVLSVVVLDAIMIGAYHAFHVRDRLQKTQMMFVTVWVVLTLIVVSTIMKRIRGVRRRR